MGTTPDAEGSVDVSGDRPRVVILGDSWVRGLGPERRKAFGRRIAGELHAAETLDLSAISRTGPDVVANHLDAVSTFRPQVAVLGVGGADSLVFPAPWIQAAVDRFAPPAWHGVEGMMLPIRRPRDRRQRWRQNAENVAKIAVKQLLVHAFGGHRRVSVEGFEQSMVAILDRLEALDCAPIVLGFAAVDGRFSPGTNASVLRTNAVLQALCATRPEALYVDSQTFLRRWADYLPDHVHLNAAGHEHVATEVMAAIASGGFRWSAPLTASGPEASRVESA